MSCPRCKAGKALRRVQDMPLRDVTGINHALRYAQGMLEVIAFGEGDLCGAHVARDSMRPTTLMRESMLPAVLDPRYTQDRG